MRLFRLALEKEEVPNVTDHVKEEKISTIIMKGPLSEVYTKALKIAYAKDPDTGITEIEQKEHKEKEAGTVEALESSAIDVAIANAVAANSSQVTPTDSFQTVYGVAKDYVNDDTLLDISKELNNCPENSEFILIIDGTQAGPDSQVSSIPQERMVQIQSAIECLVDVYKGKIFHSLEEFKESFKK